MKLFNNLTLVGATIAVLALVGCGGPAVVPSSYYSFTDANTAFKLEAPGGWDCQSGTDKKHYSWAIFSSGPAEIVIDTDSVRVLIAKIAVLGINPITPGGGLSAPKVHWLEREGFEAKKEVKEDEPQSLDTDLSEVRRSEFTGTAHPIHGYRATATNGDRRIQIVCTCPAADWDRLKPVFDKVIESLSQPASQVEKAEREAPQEQEAEAEQPQGGQQQGKSQMEQPLEAQQDEQPQGAPSKEEQPLGAPPQGEQPPKDQQQEKPLMEQPQDEQPLGAQPQDEQPLGAEPQAKTDEK